MEPETKNSSLEDSSVLQLSWINAPDGVEKELSIPVDPENSLSQCLEDIFKKTTELAEFANSAYIGIKSPTFDPSLLQLFQDESLLTTEEQNRSIGYFTAAKERSKILLNTRHCGKLFLRVTDENEESKSILEFDYGKDTLENVVQSLQQHGHHFDYVYSDSALYVWPGVKDLDKVFVREEFAQFSEIKFRNKSSESEIFINVQIMFGSKFTFHADSLTTIEEAKRLMVAKSGVPALLQEIYIDSTELEDSESLSSYGLQDGSVISLQRPTDTDAFSIALRFADMDEDNVELQPKGNTKYEKPEKGLNIKGHCANETCKIYTLRLNLLVPWTFPTFDLIQDSGKVFCPKCLQPVKILAPVFHLTEWQFYGTKRDEQNGEQEVKIKSNWNKADDPDSVSGFEVIDTPGHEFGLGDWTELWIQTRPLIEKKFRISAEDWRNIGGNVAEWMGDLLKTILPALLRVG